jgi:hypothetical protein
MLAGLLASSILSSVLILLMIPVINSAVSEDPYLLQDFISPTLHDTLMFLGLIAGGVFAMSLLPWVVAMIVSERRHWNDLAYFTWLGAAIGIGWFFMGYLFSFDHLFRELVFMKFASPDTFAKSISLGLLALAVGAFGGLTYWAIAGRHSGEWKSNP